MTPKISVIVPTYGRPGSLRRCLDSLLGQTTSSSYEVIVVRRDEDEPTLRVIAEVSARAAPTVRTASPEGPGFLRALRAGIATATGEIVAFADDDAVYPRNWVERLAALIDADGVGGAGGTIREAGKGSARPTTRQHGRLTVSGRQPGSAYDALPPEVVEVDVLPGANMAYRRELIGADSFPLALELNGGAPGNETLVGAVVRRQGFRLLCDTTLVVEHHRAPRAEGHRLTERSDRYGLARSRSFVMRHVLRPAGYALFLLRIVLVGESELPGIARLIVDRRLSHTGYREWLSVIRGLRAGYQAACDVRVDGRGVPLNAVAIPDLGSRCSSSN